MTPDQAAVHHIRQQIEFLREEGEANNAQAANLRESAAKLKEKIRACDERAAECFATARALERIVEGSKS